MFKLVKSNIRKDKAVLAVFLLFFYLSMGFCDLKKFVGKTSGRISIVCGRGRTLHY